VPTSKGGEGRGGDGWGKGRGGQGKGGEGRTTFRNVPAPLPDIHLAVYIALGLLMCTPRYGTLPLKRSGNNLVDVLHAAIKD